MSMSKRRYKVLPLFASPLEEHLAHHQGRESDSDEHESHSGAAMKSQTEALTTEIHRHRVPIFREREEASTIELFYDLFFVANLSSFTAVHSIDEATMVKSYVGFFALLWFTWLQVTLYDARFSVDSIFERVCKALQFGVMIAFAVVGTQFNTKDTAKYAVVFQQFSVIMLVSKVILVIQYGYVLYWVRGYRKIVTPLLIHMFSYAIGAVVCLCVVFIFDKEKKSNAYFAWYIVAVGEALAVFISSSRWRSVSFKRTHLHERVGLLTLIILGEGVIILTKSMTYVTKGGNYSSAVIGQIISSTVIIYFIYMLYFDQVDAKRFGTIRHQFWALAHFPFHVALVLFLEGTSRFVIWRNAMENTIGVIARLEAVLQSSSNTTELSGALNAIVDDVAGSDPGLGNIIAAERFKSNISSAFDALAASVDIDSRQASDALSEIVGLILRSIFQFFNLKAPKKDTMIAVSPDTPKDPLSEVNAVLHVYDLVFVYFFVAAGCTLLMLSLLIALAKKNKCLGDYVAIVVRVIMGLGLASVATLKANPLRLERFLMSPWILPTVVLALAVVVFLDGLFGYLLPAAPVTAKSETSSENSSLRSESPQGKNYDINSAPESDDNV